MSTITKTKEKRAIVYKQIYFRQSKIFTTFFNVQGEENEVNNKKIRLCNNLLYLVFLYKQLYNIRVKRDADAAAAAVADAAVAAAQQEQNLLDAVAQNAQQGVVADDVVPGVNTGNIIDRAREQALIPERFREGGGNKTRRKSRGKSKRKSKRKSRRKSKRKSKRSTHTNH